jgi:hypothetical protein
MVGGTTSIMKVLENLRLSATVVTAMLMCDVPAASLSVSRQVAERLFAALGTARVPPAIRRMDPNQPFSPKLFLLQHADPFYRIFTVQENPTSGRDLLTSTNVKFIDEGTGAEIPVEEWHPMFTAAAPETLQQMTGWSLATVSDIRILTLHDAYPRATFWKFLSMIKSLRRISVEAAHVLDFLPSLFTLPSQDPTTLPYPLLQHIQVDGTLSSDTGSERLLQPIGVALQNRLRLISQSATPGDVQPLESLELRHCLSPLDKTVLEALPATLVKGINCWIVSDID